MFICDNSNCKVWLHKECLEEEILAKTYTRLVEGENGSQTNGVARSNGKKTKSKPKYKGLFSARIQEIGDQPPVAVISDLRSGSDKKSWEESIKCPKCATELS